MWIFLELILHVFFVFFCVKLTHELCVFVCVSVTFKTNTTTLKMAGMAGGHGRRYMATWSLTDTYFPLSMVEGLASPLKI